MFRWQELRSPLSEPSDLANTVLDTLEITTIPIDVETVCQRLDIPIYRTDFESGETGQIRFLNVGNTSTFFMLVNRHKSRVDQRLVIARQLGHALLHFFEGGELSASEKATNAANAFAHELLVPTKVLKLIGAEFCWDASLLAEAMNVSHSFMQERLQSFARDGGG